MKIKEITLIGRDDPVQQEHIENTQIPMFRSAAQQNLNQTGYPDVVVEIDDVFSAATDLRSVYMVKASLTRKTETETFLVHFVSDSPVLHITYCGMRSLYEIQEFQQGASPPGCVAAAIRVMADILFGHLACRV